MSYEVAQNIESTCEQGQWTYHVDSINRLYISLSDTQRFNIKTILCKLGDIPVVADRRIGETCPLCIRVEYETYHGFFAADRQNTAPPLASTRRICEISTSKPQSEPYKIAVGMSIVKSKDNE